MMADIDSFTHWYGLFITSSLGTAFALDTVSRTERPAAYEPSLFATNHS
jgi:hypothetical protein